MRSRPLPSSAVKRKRSEPLSLPRLLLSSRTGAERREPTIGPSDWVKAAAQSRSHAHAHHFLVVFGFVGLGHLAAVGGVDAAPARAAGIARILARTHLGMAATKRGDLLVELDRRDRPILAAAGGANV